MATAPVATPVGISENTPHPADSKPKKRVLTPRGAIALIRQHEATIAQKTAVIKQQTLSYQGLKRSLGRWRKFGVLAIMVAAALAWFHVAPWVDGTDSSAKNTVQEVVASVPVVAGDKNANQLSTKKASLIKPADFSNGRFQIVKTHGTSFEILGEILNDDEFAVFGIVGDSRKSGSEKAFPLGTLNKKTMITGSWESGCPDSGRSVIQIKQIGTKEPICQKTFLGQPSGMTQGAVVNKTKWNN